MRGSLVQTLIPILMATVLGGGCGGGDEGVAAPADTAVDVAEALDSLALDAGTSSDTDVLTEVDIDAGDDTARSDADAATGADSDSNVDATADTVDDAAPGGDTSIDGAIDGTLDSGLAADATGDGDATTTVDSSSDAGAASDAADGGDAALDGPVDAGPVTDVADGGDAGPKKCSAHSECDDGMFCNGAETCDPSTGDPITGCRPGAPPDCSDGFSCTVDSCSESTSSCVHLPQDAACDDSLFCNGVERCDPATGAAVSGCKAGAAVACADGIACTIDACSEVEKRCTRTPDHALCADGDFCNGAEVCDVTLGCLAGAPPACDDARTCTSDGCDSAADSCTHLPNHTLCAAGFYCSPTGPSPTGCVAGTPSSAPSSTFDASCEHCDDVSRTCRIR